ncbi:MAG: twitching motility protein PilT [Lachnospiraceae bacterium]|nr:twitching motility protein PilT [Lachnospiraceae bacterium]
MVQLIVGDKGKGKTKELLDKANNHIKTVEGNIVYLDKSTKHMYELNNKIRLINVTDYMISDADEFVGFLSGIISQDHDLQAIYIDGFLKIAALEGQDISPTVQKIKSLSEKFHVDVTISVSLDSADIPESLKSDIAVAV